MTAHCAGEAGMDELLDGLSAGRSDRRHPRPTLADHACQLHLGAELEDVRELGVAADLQPAWLWKDTRTLLAVLGPGGWSGFTPIGNGSTPESRSAAAATT